MRTKNLKIKLRDSQVSFVEEAIERFMVKCPLRFSEPVVSDGVLDIDPHDFEELINYISVIFENELEVARLKKLVKRRKPKGKPLKIQKRNKGFGLLMPKSFQT